MPAIASLEDLRAAQKKGLSINAMLYLVLQSRNYCDGGCAMRFAVWEWRRIGWRNV